METETQRRPGLVSSMGVLKGAATGDRLLVVPAKFWAGVKGFLESAYGSSVDMVLTRFAEEWGEEYAERRIADGLKPQDVLSSLEEVATVSGWGELKVSMDSDRGHKIEVQVRNCAFCNAAPATHVGRCDFMAGVAVGVAKSAYGREYECVQTEVKEGEERTCKLVLDERKKDLTTDWKTSVYFPWMTDSK